MVAGSLANETGGYSANMPFWSHDATNSPAKRFDLGSAGLMVGKPDPMMMPGFPAETKFIPYLALRNTTAKPMDVTLTLNYTHGMDAAPINRNLLTQHLGPFEAKLVELRAPLHAAGLKSFDGMINLGVSFAGHGGDLILANGSVDQTGTYVFEVRPQVIGESTGTISGYWSVAGGNDAMFSLWNPTDAPQDIMATLYYGDGSGLYHLPVHLAPQASTMIDVAMLIREQQPDANGNIIPSSVREGSASFDTAGHDDNAADGKKKVTTVIAGGLFNTTNATCGMVCTYCNGYSNWGITPSPIAGPIQFTASASAHATDSYGNNQTLSGGSWSSDTPSVMTVNSSGTVTGGAVGSANITDFLSGLIVFQGNYCVNENMNDSCPQANISPQAPANTTPSITSVSPSRGLIGATTSSVTITGKGLLGGHINTPAAIQVQNITTATDTKIVFDAVISSTATAGNNAGAIYVTASGQDSNKKDFYIQVPTRLSILSGTASGTTEQLCTSNACGTIVSFKYQVYDQDTTTPQPIRASMSMWDSFGTFSPDPLGMNSAVPNTTCTFKNMTNNGPCGVNTNSDGTFTEGALGACSTVCFVGGACTTGGPSNAKQTWNIASSSIAQQDSEYCQKVLVNGTQIR